MPDETHETRNTASPYSTGGGGTRLEHRLGTVFLVRLLTAGPVLELGERAPDPVAFQQSPATSVDDLVATTSAAGGASVRLEIAVRRTPKFIRSDQKTKELVAALVRADLDAERDSDPLVERRLAVAVSGHQTHAQEIAELAVVTRGQSTADEFVELIRTPRKFATRGRLDHLIDMVAAALIEISDEDVGTPEHRCWSLLRRLWIVQVDLEAGHEDDWAGLVGDLKSIVLEPSDDAAGALRDRLEQLSAELDTLAGETKPPGVLGPWGGEPEWLSVAKPPRDQAVDRRPLVCHEADPMRLPATAQQSRGEPVLEQVSVGRRPIIDLLPLTLGHPDLDPLLSEAEILLR